MELEKILKKIFNSSQRKVIKLASDKKFLRKCIGCGSYKEKNELIKITKDSKTQETFINPISKIFGRSCYICKDENCI
ncbi:YlxR family protein, partial [bacterium]|nr:YlxR family protein [bacterium]